MKTIVLVLSLLLSSNLWAKEVKIAVGLSLPPYIIKSKSSGIEIDIVNLALKSLGHTAKYVYVPFSDVQKKVESGEVDAGLTLKEGGASSLNFSKPYITYQNVAIALKKNNLEVSNVQSLSKYSLAAFQNARIYLGAEYKKVVSAHTDYNEYPKQINQLRKLFTGEKDVFIGDINIFKYYRSKMGRAYTEAGKQEVSIYEIFAPTDYQIAFRDAKIRDLFNEELTKIKKNGKYKKVIKSYLD